MNVCYFASREAQLCIQCLTAGADCIRGLADALEFLIGSPDPDGGRPQTPPARQHSSPGPEPGLPNGSDGGNQVTFVIAGGVLACSVAEGRVEGTVSGNLLRLKHAVHKLLYGTLLLC